MIGFVTCAYSVWVWPAWEASGFGVFFPGLLIFQVCFLFVVLGLKMIQKPKICALVKRLFVCLICWFSWRNSG